MRKSESRSEGRAWARSHARAADAFLSSFSLMREGVGGVVFAYLAGAFDGTAPTVSDPFEENSYYGSASTWNKVEDSWLMDTADVGLRAAAGVCTATSGPERHQSGNLYGPMPGMESGIPGVAMTGQVYVNNLLVQGCLSGNRFLCA